MGFRFTKRIKIAPSIKLNLSKSGISTSIGRSGASLNVGRGEAKITAGIPQTGISYTTTVGGSAPKPRARSRLVGHEQPVDEADAAARAESVESTVNRQVVRGIFVRSGRELVAWAVVCISVVLCIAYRMH